MTRTGWAFLLLVGLAAADAALSHTDPAAGACTAAGGQSVGLRPRCWYVPPAALPSPAALDERVGAAATSLTGS